MIQKVLFGLTYGLDLHLAFFLSLLSIFSISIFVLGGMIEYIALELTIGCWVGLLDFKQASLFCGFCLVHV